MALIAFSGCTAEKRLNAWPIYYRERDPAQRSSHTEVLWPFIDLDRTPQYAQSGVRPLFNVRTETAASETGEEKETLREIQALYPFYINRDDLAAGKERTWLLPLYYYQSEQKPQGRDWLRVNVLLGRVSGEVPGRGRFSANPLYGKLYSTFGYDEIDLILSPFYVHTQKGGRESSSYLFPFFSCTTAKDYRYVRVWPLVGNATRGGEFAHGFLLWPFLSYRVQKDAAGQEARTFFLFPLFGFSSGPRSESQTVLWPLFSHQGAPAREYESWDVPAPFLRFHHGRRYSKFTLWPFYGRTVKGESDRRYVLWPFYRRSSGPGEGGRVAEYASWPFYKDRRRLTADNAVKERSVRFWPLFKYRSDAQGHSAFSALALWPYDHPEGIERNWSVFWRLFETKRDEGGWSMRLVGRLLEAEGGPQSRRLSLGPLVEWERDGAARRFSILGGLIERSWRDGRSLWKFLYLSLPSRRAQVHNTVPEDQSGP